jgi:hypothetical protein
VLAPSFISTFEHLAHEVPALSDYRVLFSIVVPPQPRWQPPRVSPLAYRNAVKAIWPENAATVERMMKRLGILLEYQREGKRKKPKARNHEAMLYNDVPSFMAHIHCGHGTASASLPTYLVPLSKVQPGISV